jgi:hypothetical protein
MKIHVLGSGGAFDIVEGNSSFIIEEAGRTILVDCGYDVFSKLRWQGWTDKIDYICITHCHDDHMGSLSAYLYYCFYILKKVIPIYDFWGDELADILSVMGMQENREYRLVAEGDCDYLNGIKRIPTKDLHVVGMKSCGFNFFDKLIISGDIGSPLNVNKNFTGYLFHDASTFDSGVHCVYDKLNINTPNLYLYHHSAEQREIMQNAGYKCLKAGDIIEI